MRLYDAVSAFAGKQAKAIKRHLNESGLNDWEDLTKGGLFAFRDTLLSEVATSSARTYFAVLRAVLERFEDTEKVCKDYRTILRAKNEKPVKTFLTQTELARLDSVAIKTDAERLVLNQFMIAALTGARLSDVRELTPDNITGGILSYVSIKTGIQSVIPCSEKVSGYVNGLSEIKKSVTTAGFEKIIRRLCKRAGIDSTVKVYKAGRHLEGPKWMFVSSHTARISFCTNLSKLGVPLIDVSRLAGHSSVTMTERYIVKTAIKLPDTAMSYLSL